MRVGHRLIAAALLSLLVLTVSLVGCSTATPASSEPQTAFQPFPEGTATDWCDQFYENLDHIEVGKTTRSQLLTLFGRPDPERSTDTSLAWLYPELWPCMEPESEQLVFKPVVGLRVLLNADDVVCEVQARMYRIA